MSEVKALFTLTKQMRNRFSNTENEERETLIADFEDFVSKREKLLKQIEGPLSDDEKELTEEVIAIDAQLQKQVDQYLNGFQQDFQSFKKKQTSNKKYINPYQNLHGRDGSFIDKRN
ncbi:flagellar protein FliT [Halalkalibacillus halophilus]|uniref:flagellar protein FliT n=1 Tax=Halalkalibacillus halophilus TaxID=392827 RepID=UPI00040D6DAA|nr:flagellar protein FliT [Halalkalibacillus halophilus]